jgi:hypothetical protein
MHRFHGQFLLHGQSKTRCEEWQPSQIGPFRLETHPSLPVVPIRAGGRSIGVFLGYPIAPQQQYLPPVAWVPHELDLNSPPALDEWLYAWRGRWVAIVHGPNLGTRLYLDAIGSLSCVYSSTQGFCASSPLLYPCERDEELIRTYGMPESGRFYPAGLTPFKGVTRLLPNHYLDLDRMTTYRHWPLHNFKQQSDTADLITQIYSRLSANIRSVTQE